MGKDVNLLYKVASLVKGRRVPIFLTGLVFELVNVLRQKKGFLFILANCTQLTVLGSLRAWVTKRSCNDLEVSYSWTS